jgi:hypothetical protein
MPPSRAGPTAALAAWCTLALAALVWPGYALFGARIEPLVFGLPFSVFWVVLWVVLTFAVLCLYDALARGSDRK